MILAVDIGNTNTAVGLFRGGRLARRFALPTAMARDPGRLRKRLRAAGSRSREAVVCSVVPWATPSVVRALRAAGCPRVRVAGRGLRVPLRNHYRYPRQVGQDRLVGAYAAWTRFKRDCIVCDFGTAITIDVVTRRGEYLGGVIAPGLEISLEALATRTALLPKVALKEPPELLGRDTANSIRAGLVYGCAALCDGLVGQLKRRYAPRATVIATGGAGPLIAKYCSSITRLRPHLVLEGLYKLSLKKAH
ncbi:MAG: type III pantothenate kinase [Candidatus Omnitrophica bacterium]|nr:type III pantothenate kinase [Candidatus Omnitrophota bacterium]